MPDRLDLLARQTALSYAVSTTNARVDTVGGDESDLCAAILNVAEAYFEFLTGAPSPRAAEARKADSADPETVH